MRFLLDFEAKFASDQEPLNAPFLNGAVFQAIFKRENGPLRHSGKRPIKVGKLPIKEGKRPINLNGNRIAATAVHSVAQCFRNPFHADPNQMVTLSFLSFFLLEGRQEACKEHHPPKTKSMSYLYFRSLGTHPNFRKNALGVKKAILGALGEFRGILGAALGIGNSILGIRNSILGMASHDLINTKPRILGATLGAIPGIAANPPERFSFMVERQSIAQKGVRAIHARNSQL